MSPLISSVLAGIWYGGLSLFFGLVLTDWLLDELSPSGRRLPVWGPFYDKYILGTADCMLDQLAGPRGSSAAGNSRLSR